MLEMTIFAKCHVQIAHAKGEMLRECVDGGRVDWSTRDGSVGIGKVRVGSCETFG